MLGPDPDDAACKGLLLPGAELASNIFGRVPGIIAVLLIDKEARIARTPRDFAVDVGLDARVFGDLDDFDAVFDFEDGSCHGFNPFDRVDRAVGDGFYPGFPG